MAKRFTYNKIFLLLTVAGIAQQAMAGGFQLWEQSGEVVGNYHAGVAAEAADASTAWFNPAGLTRIHNQQFVLGLDPIVTNIKFRGTVNTNTAGFESSGLGPQYAVAPAGGFSLVPDMHYAAPLTDSNSLVFGLSLVAPFGAKTDYSTNTDARYGATDTWLKVMDLSPALGWAFNDKFSVGAGLDLERAEAEFDLVGGSPALNTLLGGNYDGTAANTGYSSGYGYHLGALFQVTPTTRIGLTYHSPVVFKFHGNSRFDGLLSQFDPDTLATLGLAFIPSTDQLSTKITTPARTSLGFFHTINPTWDVMGTLTYTQWNVFNQIVLQNVSGLVPLGSGNSLTVTIPQNFHNTWTYAFGANYHATEKCLLRGGLGYDQTPTNNRNRNLQLPDADRIAVAMGTHYQATKTMGFDFGWTHYFIMNTRINNVTQTVGAQTTTVNGTVSSSADVYGLQMTWDIV